MKKLEELLVKLWNSDNSVPAAVHYRCTELDWFSGGIKDNVVAYIAAKILGIERAEELLDVRIHKGELND